MYPYVFCKRVIYRSGLFGLALILSACSRDSSSPQVLAQDARPSGGPLPEVKSDKGSLAQGWWQFRGRSGLGISLEKTLPLTWSADTNLLWKTELPGAGASSPIVVGDRVFVTCYSGYGVPGQAKGDLNQLKRHLVCLNTNGKILWNKEVPAALPESSSVREHGYAASTPAYDGERLYVFFGKSGVYSFDLEGKQLWKANVGDNHNDWGSAASPVIYNDLVIINACIESESLIALDKKTGKEKWRAKGIKESWNTPIILTNKDGTVELVVAVIGKILAFNPDSGEPIWNCDTDIRWYMAPSMVWHNGVVYALGGRSGVTSLAVRTGGKGDVTKTHRLWTSTKGSNVSSPVVHDGHLYWMNDNLGIAYCAEAETGKIIYEERVGRAGQVYASPILADGKLYYLSRSGATYVLKASPKYELLATNDLSDEGSFDASPAASEGRIYIRSNRFLYSVGEK